MVKNFDAQSRKKAVLGSTISRYISKAEPVSSEEIAAEFDLSSATIRNIFAELEKEGLLKHPYTSGGRIPTDKGYRFYVDSLISRMELLDEEKSRISREYEKQMRRLEDALEGTSEIISAITHYAGIVSFLDWQDRFFYRGISSILEQPEFQDFNRLRMIVRLIEDKHRMLDLINRDLSGKTKVYIGEELGYPEMNDCSLVVTGYRRKKKPSGRLAVLGPARMEYRQIIPALDYISDTLSLVLEDI